MQKVTSIRWSLLCPSLLAYINFSLHCTVPVVQASLTIGVHANEETDDLTVDSDWWFDRLLGIPHFYSTSLGPLNIHGAAFTALPPVQYLLILFFSPWTMKSRNVLPEFDRLSQALHQAHLQHHIMPLTVDCSWQPSIAVCRRFLGIGKDRKIVYQDGINVPQLGRYVFTEIRDGYLGELPLLLLATREDLMVKSNDELISRVAAPPSAELMLDWLVSTKVEAAGVVQLGHIKIMLIKDFNIMIMRRKNSRAEQHSTEQGCLCKETWTHCDENVWGLMQFRDDRCVTAHYCPAELGYCKTETPCGPKKALTDKCQTKEHRTNDFVPHHSAESDVEAALALFLHHVFARHVFETKEQDPTEYRRRVLRDMVQVLCSYFPDHLTGRSVVLKDGWDPSTKSECRESLCVLGGLLAMDRTWEMYTEEIDVVLEPDLNGDPPPDTYDLYVKQRIIKWRDLERDWNLCGRPWNDFAMEGWEDCQSELPLARGYPCGMWMLMHSLLAEVASTHDCAYAKEEDVDRCVGPPKNKTLVALKKLHAYRRKEAHDKVLFLHKELNSSESWGRPVNLAPRNDTSHGHLCWKVLHKRQTLALSAGRNLTLVLQLDHFYNDIVEGTLLKIGSKNYSHHVYVKLLNDWVRKDGGAVILSAEKAPDGFQRAVSEHWKLRTVGDVSVHGRDWRTMLAHAPKEKLIFEGPVNCYGLPHCKLPCAEFVFEPDVGMVGNGLLAENPVGQLRERRTGLCLDRFVHAPWYNPFGSIDDGWGVWDCQGQASQRFVVKRHEHRRDDYYCERDNAQQCLHVHQSERFRHLKWIPVPEVPEDAAGVEGPRVVLQTFRNVVAMFWNCPECRHNFLSLPDVQVHKHPKDAVLWLWDAHNEINKGLQHVEDHASSLPADPRFLPKQQWPSPDLCPSCYKDGQFDRDQVYDFMINSFYISKLKRKSKEALLNLSKGKAEFVRDGVVQQKWANEPLQTPPWGPDSLAPTWMVLSTVVAGLFIAAMGAFALAQVDVLWRSGLRSNYQAVPTCGELLQAEESVSNPRSICPEEHVEQSPLLSTEVELVCNQSS